MPATTPNTSTSSGVAARTGVSLDSSSSGVGSGSSIPLRGPMAATVLEAIRAGALPRRVFSTALRAPRDNASTAATASSTRRSWRGGGKEGVRRWG